jgi:hypothetical protein
MRIVTKFNIPIGLESLSPPLCEKRLEFLRNFHPGNRETAIQGMPLLWFLDKIDSEGAGGGLVSRPHLAAWCRVASLAAKSWRAIAIAGEG